MNMQIIDIELQRKKFMQSQSISQFNFSQIYNLKYIQEALQSSILTYPGLFNIFQPIYCQTNIFVTRIINQSSRKCNNMQLPNSVTQYVYPIINFMDLPSYKSNNKMDILQQSSDNLFTYDDLLYSRESVFNQLQCKSQFHTQNLKPQISQDTSLYPQFLSQQTKNTYQIQRKILQKYQISEKTQLQKLLYRNRQKPALRLLYAANKINISQNNKIRSQNALKQDFYIVKMCWLEATIQLLKQLQSLLNGILISKKISFQFVNDQFILEQKTQLLTKQKKQGRIGNLFNIFLETGQFLKQIVNQIYSWLYGLQNIQEASSAILFIYSNLSKSSGLYRYKFKLNKYLTCIKSLQELQSQSISLYLKFYQKLYQDTLLITSKYVNNYLQRLTNVYDAKKNSIITRQRRTNAIQSVYYSSNSAFQQYFTQAWKLRRQQFIKYFNPNLTVEQLYLINQKTLERWQHLSQQIIEQRKNIYFQLKQYNYKQMIENFLQFKQIVLKQIIEQDQLNYQSIQTYKTQQEIKNLYIQLKQKFNTVDKIKKEEILQKSTISLIENSLINQYKQTNNIEISNLLILFNSNFEEFINKLISALQSKQTIQEIDMYDYYTYTQIRITSNYQTELLNQIILLIFQTRFNFLFQQYGLSSELSGLDQFNLICKINEKYDLQVVQQSIGILYNINLKFIHKVLQFFFDIEIVDYIYQYFTAKIQYKQLSFQLNNSIITSNQLFIIPYIIIQYAKHSCSHNVQYIQYQKLQFYDFNDFITNQKLKQGYFFNINKSNNTQQVITDIIQDSSALDLVLPLMRQKVTYLSQVVQNYPTIIQNLFRQILCSDKSIISIYYNNFSFLGFNLNKQLNKITVSLIMEDLVKDQFKQLFSHLSTSMQNNVNKSNKIIISILTYYQQISINFKNILQTYQYKLVRSIQKLINTFDQRRYNLFMFILQQDNGGLGMLNFIDNYPNILDYIKANTKQNQYYNQQKQLLQFQDINILKLDSLTDKQIIIDHISYQEEIIRAQNLTDSIKKFSLLNFSQQNYMGTYYQNYQDGIIQQQQSQIIHQSKQTKAQFKGQLIFRNKLFISFWSPILNRCNVYLGKLQNVPNTGIQYSGKLNSISQFYASIFRNNMWVKIHQTIIMQIQQYLEKQINNQDIKQFSKHVETIFGINKSPLNINQNAYDLQFIDVETQQLFNINLQLIFTSFDYYENFDLQKQCYQFIKNKANILYIFVDLLYCRVLFKQFPQDNFQFSQLQICFSKILQTNQQLALLRSRIQTSLQIKNFNHIHEESLNQNNWQSILQQNSFYIQSFPSQLGQIFILINFGLATFQIYIKTKENDLKQLILIIYQQSLKIEQSKFYIEDPILKRTLEQYSIEHNEVDNLNFVISHLSINLSPLKKLLTYFQYSYCINFSASSIDLGGSYQQFFRFILFLILIEQNSPNKGIQIASQCKPLQQIPFYQQLFTKNRGKTEITISQFDNILTNQAQMYFKVRFNRQCSNQQLLYLLLGLTQNLDIKTEVIFTRNENKIISNVIQQYKQLNQQTGLLQTLVDVQYEDISIEQKIVVVPTNINQYSQLQNKGYTVVGIQNQSVIEIRALIKNFTNHNRFINLGFFGSQMKIDGIQLIYQGTLIFTQKYTIQLLQQINDKLQPILFID
ncbi:putative pre-mRNA-processing-splicing factor [Spironucleus salmonicida]|uniref:Pre-mRNA-processing-splicing factor n=1 Tax=Spironucleus salmonicida TaxID=348837 RepID=V6LHF7_9EUKA|nr:putative pre-mRNA-processing-splicing factor [Spironucleus salmonicida]|eukprot:EST44000.1 Putative pre-mRNA-processing-splicing factor [Spironucleus salmonicida]